MDEREPAERAEPEEECPLEREELALPDGRRLILYSRRDDPE
jgi:hypothetical protein